MLNPEAYQKQIERLEKSYMYSINTGAIDLWIKELEDAGIEDCDLVKGIDYILNNPSKFINRPHLGNLLELCGRAKSERWEVEESKKKAKLAHDILETSTTTEHGKRSLSLIKLFLKGYYEKDGKPIKLTNKDRVDYMLKMEEYYPGEGWEKEAMGLRKAFNL